MSIKNFSTAFLLIISISLLSCGGEDSSFEPNLGNAPINPNQQLLANLINDIRAEGTNCSGENFAATNAMVFNDLLNTIAQKHAEYLQSIDQLTHTGANESSLADRLSADEYNYSVAAENLAKGFADEESVVDAWKNSDGHCQNIMNPEVDEMGVGTSGAFWVMIYAAD